VFVNLIPVFAALLAVVFLGERIAGYHLVAAALVFAGVVLINRERR
jgi:drug/metabolite transporter (DMT)-like permease